MAIVQNPYTENPRALFDELKGTGEYSADDQLDREGIDMLKRKLKKSKMIKAK